MSTNLISATELDLLTFFEMEPIRTDPDVEWPYNDFLYEIQCGDKHLAFSVAPSYKDLSIKIQSGGTPVFELVAMDVSDVRYHGEKSDERLEIVISGRERLWLRIKPSISISQFLGREDAR
jgi:hypothetical protein